MGNSPTFNDLLAKMLKVHESKKHDYSSATNMFSNFEFSASLAAQFADPTDKVFVMLMGVKLARLAELLNGDRTPLNESIEDSFLDLSNYATLWWLNRAQRNIPSQVDGAKNTSSTTGDTKHMRDYCSYDCGYPVDSSGKRKR